MIVVNPDNDVEKDKEMVQQLLGELQPIITLTRRFCFGCVNLSVFLTALTINSNEQKIFEIFY